MKLLRKIIISVLAISFAGALALQFKSARRLASDGLHQVKRMDGFYRYRSGRQLRGTPDLKDFEGRLAEKGLKLGAPLFMRIFKAESELEIWMKDGRKFKHFATYPICNWSGRLGPKLKQGDHQSPEGFYTVTRGQLNPNSRWHRSFNLGYPNVFDRSHKRTGDYIMVHGGCGSVGCYAMTNPVIDEIWRIITTSLKSGQPRFHVHVYPFRMTRWNIGYYGDGKWNGFWQDLKAGYDLFEQSHIPPEVSVCGQRYQVRPGSPGSLGRSAITKRCTAPHLSRL